MNNLDTVGKEQNWYFLQEYKGLIVSCSGGIDSTALFHVLYQELKRKKNFPLVLLHFNFGLRSKESDEDENFVRKLAEDHGIPILVRKVTAKERENRSEKNIQAWARAIRLNKFRELSQNGWVIALGHQKDDLAENILLRLIRGVSPGSMLGMEIWNPPYWRPFLETSRDAIVEWMHGHNLPHRRDSSNDKMDYSRNVIRKSVLPELKKLNANALDHLIRCAHETKEFVDFARASLPTRDNPSEESPHKRTHVIDRETLEHLPKSVAYDLLSCEIGRPEGKGINHKILEQALGTIQRTNAKKSGILVRLPSGRSLLQQRGKISVSSVLVGAQKPRYKQHASAVFHEERAIILGPAAIVDFFPVPSGTVLDQKFRVRNSEPEVRKVKDF